MDSEQPNIKAGAYMTLMQAQIGIMVSERLPGAVATLGEVYKIKFRVYDAYLTKLIEKRMFGVAIYQSFKRHNRDALAHWEEVMR